MSGGIKQLSDRTPFYTQVFWFQNSMDPSHLYINVLVIVTKRKSSLYQTSLPPTTLFFAPICYKTLQRCVYTQAANCDEFLQFDFPLTQR